MDKIYFKEIHLCQVWCYLMDKSTGSSTTWKDLERDHNDGLAHKDGVCPWCDHIRDLDSEGHYDFLKQPEVQKQ